jgi:hypothetical protein
MALLRRSIGKRKALFTRLLALAAPRTASVSPRGVPSSRLPHAGAWRLGRPPAWPPPSRTAHHAGSTRRRRGGSCAPRQRIMCRALSHAVSEGAISRSCAPATGVEAFGQPWGAPSGHTWNAQRPDAHLPPVLRPSAAAAMGAPASATPRTATTHGRSNRPPSPGSAAARPWPIPSRWWAEAQ